MSWFRSPKFCAALVLITWLLALIAVWGVAAAGRDTVSGDSKKTCLPADLKSRALQLELLSSPREAPEALKILNGGTIEDSCAFWAKESQPCAAGRALGDNPVQASCVCRCVAAQDCAEGVPACLRKGMAAQIHADYFFIPAYSALNLALFLFVGIFWDTSAQNKKRTSISWTLLALGVLLSLAMAVGDVRENLHLTAILDIAKTSLEPETAIGERLPALAAAANLKWGTLALSALLLAVFWKSRTSSRLVWVPRIFGLVTGVTFAAGLTACGWRLAEAGMAGLFLLWLAGFIHALAVLTAGEPVSKPQSSREIRRNHERNR